MTAAPSTFLDIYIYKLRGTFAFRSIRLAVVAVAAERNAAADNSLNEKGRSFIWCVAIVRFDDTFPALQSTFLSAAPPARVLT
jgi:hypothetical protein